MARNKDVVRAAEAWGIGYQAAFDKLRAAADETGETLKATATRLIAEADAKKASNSPEYVYPPRVARGIER